MKKKIYLKHKNIKDLYLYGMNNNNNIVKNTLINNKFDIDFYNYKKYYVFYNYKNHYKNNLKK